MDRGRAARGGQKPTTPTTRLIRGFSRIDAYYATGLGLCATMERAEVLGGTYISTGGPGRHQGGAKGAPRRRQRRQRHSEGSP